MCQNDSYGDTLGEVKSLFRNDRRNRTNFLGSRTESFLRDSRLIFAAVCVCLSSSNYALPCVAFEPGDKPSPSNVHSESNSDLVFVQRLSSDLKLFASDRLLLRVWLTPLIPQIDVFPKTPVGLTENESAEKTKMDEVIDIRTVIDLNNDGVKRLNVDDCRGAIADFEKAIAADPDYKLAYENLAVAYNNYGLQLRRTPMEALREFHLAIFVNPSNMTTAQNMSGIIRMMKRDPDSFSERVNLGDQEFSLGNFVGAVVEYKAALELHEEPDVRKKLIDAFSQIPYSQKRLDQLFIKVDTASGVSSDSSTRRVKSSRPYPLAAVNSYLVDLNQQITRVWNPNRTKDMRHSTIVFRINGDGNVSDVTVYQSSGDKTVDESEIAIVRLAAPFAPPPIGSFPIFVQYTFDLKSKYREPRLVE
jgi:TonB family protein